MAIMELDSRPKDGQMDSGQRSWSLVARNGLNNKRIPNSIPRKDEHGEKERWEYTTIWEEEDIAHKMIARKAAAILQCATYTEAVYFEFRKQDFKHYTEAYDLIGKEVGRLKGVRQVTRYSYQASSTLMVEVQFIYPADRTKAIREGFTFNGINYKGTPANDGSTDKLVRVTLSQLPYFLPDDVLLKELLEGLRRYGKVCQVKKISNRGYFEGDALVILDIQPVDGVKWQPLERKLHMEPWELDVIASFRGAPPICYRCKESGHVKDNCPKMANVTCYNCQGKGHYARRCKEKTRSEREALDEYIRKAAIRDAEREPGTTIDLVDEQATTPTVSVPMAEYETHMSNNEEEDMNADQRDDEQCDMEGAADMSLILDDEPTQQEKSSVTTARKTQKTHLTKIKPQSLSKHFVSKPYQQASQSNFTRSEMLKATSINSTTEHKRKMAKKHHEELKASQALLNLDKFTLLPEGHITTNASGRQAHD